MAMAKYIGSGSADATTFKSVAFAPPMLSKFRAAVGGFVSAYQEYVKPYQSLLPEKKIGAIEKRWEALKFVDTTSATWNGHPAFRLLAFQTQFVIRDALRTVETVPSAVRNSDPSAKGRFSLLKSRADWAIYLINVHIEESEGSEALERLSR